VLRRTKAVRNANAGDLAALVSASEHWAIQSVWIVIAALVVEALAELAAAGSWWVRSAEFLSNVIVALGIWAELALSRAGSVAQAEQLRQALEENARLATNAMGLASGRSSDADEAKTLAYADDAGSAMGMASNAQRTADDAKRLADEALREVRALAERLKDQ